MLIDWKHSQTISLKLLFVVGMFSEPPALLSSTSHDPNYVIGKWIALTNAGVLIGIGIWLTHGSSSGPDVCRITRLSM